MIQYICQLTDKGREACRLTKDHLGKAQTKMKVIQCDRKAKVKMINDMINNPVLKAPDFNNSFPLYCDASAVGIGAVLVQSDKDDVEHPVSFYSRKLSSSHQNYSTVEKEALSLILSLKHFEVYLGKSSCIVVHTDHNPLTFLNRMKHSNQRLLRWDLTLQEYNLGIKHIKGRDNIIADALNRIEH